MHWDCVEGREAGGGQRPGLWCKDHRVSEHLVLAWVIALLWCVVVGVEPRGCIPSFLPLPFSSSSVLSPTLHVLMGEGRAPVHA